MDTPGIHSIEHLVATFLRNHAEWAEKSIYLGPMGCRTGFYVIFAGDLKSEDIIGNLCYDRLFRIACYFVKHEEWAQEIVLDVFMKLWEQRARLPEVNNIEDYCFILTKNASLNYLEKENRHPTLSSEQLPALSGQADSPEDTLISEDLFARYVKALDRLPERCREVFIRLREEKHNCSCN